MRRKTWIVALTGAMALNAGGAFAVDLFESSSPAAPGSTRAPAVPTRYSKGTAASTAKAPASPSATLPVTKSFYDELLAEPAAKGSGKPSLRPASAAVSSKRPASAPPSKSIPFEQGNRVFPAAERTVKKDAVVESARFEEVDGASGGEFIQPVRAVEEVSVVRSAPTAAAITTATHTPSLSVEWVQKSDINVGQECQLELVVKNTGKMAATQVTVDAAFPTTVRLTSSEPKPSEATAKLVWNFESIPAGGEKRIQLKLIPSRRGDLGTEASVRFTGQASAVFKVEEPLLKVAIKGATEVMVGDPASQMVAVSNPGTGIAHNVSIEAILPEGLEHPQGPKLTMAIGSINPGETRQVRLGLSAVKGGSHTVHVVATSSSEATGTATCQVQVIAPSLKLAVDGPGLRYMGRHAKYDLVVSNDGSVPTNNVRATLTVPEGFEFVSAEKGGKFDSVQKKVTWFVGRLEPGQSTTMTCELNAASIGEFSLLAESASDAGLRVESKTGTRVEGTPSLSTQIVDLDDPVEIGSETAWEVRVSNEGTKAASTIAVACELPPGVELISAKGPTAAAAEKRMILFKSLKQLAPGQQAVYRIHVKGVTEGTHRLRARVTSDSLDEPLMMEEATKFYADAPQLP
jgi:uncharacterized repeat protein (TIGR01451 family)